MLCLSRKSGEAIRINSDIVVRVLEVRGDEVRLGIEADKAIPVLREEVYQRNRLKAGNPCGANSYRVHYTQYSMSDNFAATNGNMGNWQEIEVEADDEASAIAQATLQLTSPGLVTDIKRVERVYAVADVSC